MFPRAGRVIVFIAIEAAIGSVCAGLPLSLTVTPKEKLPPWYGLPEIAPVEAERLNPGGKLPEASDHV